MLVHCYYILIYCYVTKKGSNISSHTYGHCFMFHLSSISPPTLLSMFEKLYCNETKKKVLRPYCFVLIELITTHSEVRTLQIIYLHSTQYTSGEADS